MARIRSIHPGILTDEAWAQLSHAAWRLGHGLMMEADDAGVFEWKPFQLNMRIFPGRSEDVAALLSELEAGNILQSFSVNGRQFGALRNFCRFQKPRKPKYTHLRTAEVDIYIGWIDRSAEPPEPDHPPVPQKSVPPPLEVDPVPQKSGKSFQREEGGGKREDGDPNLPASIPNPALASAPGGMTIPEFKTRITEAFREARSMTQNPDTHRAELWISQGFRPDICLAVIREGLSRRNDVSGLKYFDPAIREAHENRAKPGRPANGRAPPDPNDPIIHDLGVEYPRSVLLQAAEKWDGGRGTWLLTRREAGDVKGLPPDIQAAFG